MRLLTLLCVVCKCVAFNVRSIHSGLIHPAISHLPQTLLPTTEIANVAGKQKIGKIGIASLNTALLFQIPFPALANEYEVADLPPPWIPVVFGVVLLAGVGLLTGSLGDVIDEESRLGMQSGARARKEIERSRSSYFKKK